MCNSKGMKIVDAEHNMAQLVDLIWCGEICLCLHLNEEPMEGYDVDDQKTPIVKFPQPCEYAQLLSNFVVEHSLEISIVNVMNMQFILDNLNKMSISNINNIY